AQPAQSQAGPLAVADNEIVLYRFTGVNDDGGGAGIGVATVFQCTNFSGATETIRFVLRDRQASFIINTTFTLQHLHTVTAATHPANGFLDADINFQVGVGHGSMAIAATTTSIVCTAMVVNAANETAVGTLHAVRFSPIPGTQE